MGFSNISAVLCEVAKTLRSSTKLRRSIEAIVHKSFMTYKIYDLWFQPLCCDIIIALNGM
jgi:hypothetical protein